MTPFDLAQRLIGEVPERPGALDNTFIQWCLESTGLPSAHDEVPWCSAFVNRLMWLCRLPRSKSAAARSWLTVGVPVSITEARPGADVVILKRGTGIQPGPEVTSGASGHVGLFAGLDAGDVLVVGGNQSNNVTLQRFPEAQVLGIRRMTV